MLVAGMPLSPNHPHPRVGTYLPCLQESRQRPAAAEWSPCAVSNLTQLCLVPLCCCCAVLVHPSGELAFWLPPESHVVVYSGSVAARAMLQVCARAWDVGAADLVH